MLRKAVGMILILFWVFSTAGAFDDLMDPEFKKVLKDHGYPAQIHKTQKLVKEEMKARGTCLKAFEVKIGQKPDGYLDKRTFLQWQAHKQFEKRSRYRQNNPFIEYEWGSHRTVYRPLNLETGKNQVILPLEVLNDRILVAWNMEGVNSPSRWKVVYGYGKDSKLRVNRIKPLKGTRDYFHTVLYLPPQTLMYFKLVKSGVDNENFPKKLPFSVSYQKLAQKGLIAKEVWHKYRNEYCQAVLKDGDTIKFIQP